MTEESTPTRAPNSGSIGRHTDGNGVRYQFMTVKAIRGREGATKTKWQNQGWEFIEERPGTLRTELSFRKVNPKGFGAYLAQGYAAFRRFEPRTQKLLVSGLGGLLAVLVVVGVAVAVVGGDDASEQPQPTAASEESSETFEPSAAPTEEPTEEPTEQPTEQPTTDSAAPETPAAAPYSYAGPAYEVVTIDENQTPAALSQYWIVTKSSFDFSSRAYRSQVKAIIADIAHGQGTTDFLAEVVTNREIAQAESPSTYEAFIAERGMDYAIQTIPKLEVLGWVASYTGGFDRDTGKPSDAASAYEVLWRPYATSEIEKWKPELADD